MAERNAREETPSARGNVQDGTQRIKTAPKSDSGDALVSAPPAAAVVTAP